MPAMVELKDGTCVNVIELVIGQLRQDLAAAKFKGNTKDVNEARCALRAAERRLLHSHESVTIGEAVAFIGVGSLNS